MANGEKLWTCDPMRDLHSQQTCEIYHVNYLHWREQPQEPSRDAGKSTCPICKRTWLVTPMDDCCLPACGCFGNNTSATNLQRPCEACGIEHYLKCSGNGDKVSRVASEGREKPHAKNCLKSQAYGTGCSCGAEPAAPAPSEGREKPHYTNHTQTCSYWATNVCNCEPATPAQGTLPDTVCICAGADNPHPVHAAASPRSGMGARAFWAKKEQHTLHGVEWVRKSDALTYAADQVRQRDAAWELRRQQEESGWLAKVMQLQQIANNAGADYLKEREARERAEQERDAIKKKYATLVFTIDGNFECLSTCDSYGHDEKCPNMEAAEKILLLGERAERAERALREAITICEAAKNEYERKGNNDAWEVGFTYGAGVCAEKIEALAQVQSSEETK